MQKKKERTKSVKLSISLPIPLADLRRAWIAMHIKQVEFRPDKWRVVFALKGPRFGLTDGMAYQKGGSRNEVEASIAVP